MVTVHYIIRLTTFCHRPIIDLMPLVNHRWIRVGMLVDMERIMDGAEMCAECATEYKLWLEHSTQGRENGVRRE